MVQQKSHITHNVNDLLSYQAVESAACEIINLESRVDTALNTILYNSLPQLSLILSILYCSLAWMHSLQAPSAGRPLMTASLASALLFFGLWSLLVLVKISSGHAQGLGVGIVSLVLVNTFLHMALTHDPLPSIFLIFAMLGTGYFYLSMPVLISVVAISIAGWFTVAISCVYQNSDWL
ncbi:MAG: hypothetical protein P1S60_20260, partial [Anaerolineae bacterium]|nr:hypothetical protein [Anaerolineae bacterium]